jgi:hypothetical protein
MAGTATTPGNPLAGGTTSLASMFAYLYGKGVFSGGAAKAPDLYASSGVPPGGYGTQLDPNSW